MNVQWDSQTLWGHRVTLSCVGPHRRLRAFGISGSSSYLQSSLLPICQKLLRDGTAPIRVHKRDNQEIKKIKVVYNSLNLHVTAFSISMLVYIFLDI